MASYDGWQRIRFAVACKCALTILLVARNKVVISTLLSMIISETNSVEISDAYATRYSKL